MSKQHDTSEVLEQALRPLAATLAKLLAPAVAAELARRGTSDEYTSNELPTGVSRRAFRLRCAAGIVVGSSKEGHVWRCSRTAWHASFGGAKKARKVTPEPEDANIDAMLLASGLRVTK